MGELFLMIQQGIFKELVQALKIICTKTISIMLTPLTKVDPCVSGFPFDSMHMVYLGVVRRILSYLRKKCKAQISIKQWKELAEHHKSLNGCLPS